MTRHLCIIGCNVFSDAIEFLNTSSEIRPIPATFLPSNLHLRPDLLKQHLISCIRCAVANKQYIGCLYGECFADIDRYMLPEIARRLPCGNCYEMLLGKCRYRRLMKAQPGTFFLEKDLLLDFDTLCSQPLELDNPQMRRWYFKHYRQVIYIRQPLDPDLSSRAQSVAGLLKLRLRIFDADYTDIAYFLKKLQERMNEEK